MLTKKSLIVIVPAIALLIILIVGFMVWNSPPERESAPVIPEGVEYSVPSGYERVVYGDVVVSGEASVAVADDLVILDRSKVPAEVPADAAVVEDPALVEPAPVLPEGATDPVASPISFSLGGPPLVYSGIDPVNIRCEANEQQVPISDLAEGDAVMVSWSSTGAPTLIKVISSSMC